MIQDTYIIYYIYRILNSYIILEGFTFEKCVFIIEHYVLMAAYRYVNCFVKIQEIPSWLRVLLVEEIEIFYACQTCHL